MRTNLLNYTDEFFEVGTSRYRLLNDVDTNKFVLWKKSNVPLIVIDKMTSTISGTKRTVFESHEPLSNFEKSEDRAAIGLAIEFLKKKYQ